MGRRHYTEQIPQHSRHGKQRGRQRFGELALTNTFGLRRQLRGEQAANIRQAVRVLHQEGHLPLEMKLVAILGVDLVPWEIIDKQAAQGIVKPHQVERARTYLENLAAESQQEQVAATITAASIKWNKHVRLTVVSEELEANREGVTDLLEEEFGFKGLHRYAATNSLAVDLGKCRQRIDYSQQADLQDQVLASVDRLQHSEEPLMFGGAVVYPDLARLAA